MDNMMLMVAGGNAPPPLKSAAKPGDSFPNEPTITASDTANAAKLGPLGYVAKPTTPWISGEHIIVNGHDFTWSGTFWVAGVPATTQAAQVLSIEPSSTVVGADTVSVTITGSGFTEDTTATFGGHDVPTNYVSDTELTIDIPTELLTTAGNRQVRVGSSYRLFSVAEDAL